MSKIILKANLSFAKSITEGELYEPLLQTKSGFLIKDDEGHEIDLYHHFFRIGIKTKDTFFLLPLKPTEVVKDPIPEEKAVEKEVETVEESIDDDFAIADDPIEDEPDEEQSQEDEEDDFAV